MAVDIICFGILVADCVTAPVESLPARGSLSLVERIELHVGGCASNTGIALAKLGASVAVIGGVGADDFGDFVVKTMAGAGVEASAVRRLAGAQTAATVVCVHRDSERSFLHVPGANAAFTLEDIDWSAVDGARIFHIAGPQLMVALEQQNGIAAVAREAERRGLVTTLDTTMNPRSLGWAALVDAMPSIDWFLPSEAEAAQYTDAVDPLEQAHFFLSAGAKNVAIKRGGDGCLVVPGDGNPFTVPSLPVQAVDALGAGDSWVAGFLVGLAEGWPIERTARFANAVGACCVQAYGATTGIRSREETLAMISV